MAEQKPTYQVVVAPKKESTEKQGDTGVVVLNYVDEFIADYSSELVGRSGMVRLWKMATGESMCGMILRGIKNPIKSSKWQVLEADDFNTEEKKAHALINDYFFKNASVPFSNRINQILTMCEFGHSVFEIYWKPYEFDGNTYLMPVIEQRMQTSIEKFNDTKQVVEFVKSDGKTVDIPYSDLAVFILDYIGTDSRGKSLLREAYGEYKDKLYYNKIMGIGMQRAATGIPHGKVPAGTTKDSAKYKALKTLLNNMITHEKAWMITEADTEFKIENQSYDPEKSLKVLEYKDSKMAMSVLMQFLLLGQNGNGGAYSLGQDQSDFFLSGINYIVNIIQETLNPKVVSKIVKLNFANVDPERIKIASTDVNTKVNKEMAEIIKYAIDSKIINPEVQDEVFFRKLYSIPGLTKEQITKRIEQKDAADNGGNDDGNDSPDDNPDGDDPVPDDPDARQQVSQQIKLSETEQAKVTERKKTIESESRRMALFMKEQLYFINDKLLVDIKKVLDTGTVELRGLKNIELRGTAKYQKILASKIAGLVDLGWMQEEKKAKKNKIKLAESEDIDPKKLKSKDLQAFSENYAEQLVDDQTETLKAQAIYTAQNGIMKGLSVGQTMSRVERATIDFIEGGKVSTGVGLSVTTSINFGMNEFNDGIKNELQGYRFVAVDDGATSDICLWYNGKTFSVDSPELAAKATPPLHPNCRSYLEPVYKFEDKIELDDTVAPPSVQKGQSIL